MFSDEAVCSMPSENTNDAGGEARYNICIDGADTDN